MRLIIDRAKLIRVVAVIGASALSMPANAVILRGSFSGVVASGYYNGPDEVLDVIGRAAFASIDHMTDRNEGNDSGFAGIDAPYASGGDQVFGGTSYSAGRLRARFGFFDSSNSSVGIDFIADVVDGQFLNWRGTMSGGGQLGNDRDWGFDVVLTDLKFSGTYVGPIPEPATWAMMIAGFGMAGAAVRRDRRVQMAMVA